jgi:hypothetical protein
VTIHIAATLDMLEDDCNLTRISYHPASDAAAQAVINADPKSLDGRSNWLWFRLPNGDLIFGCFPEGETYMAHEREYP